MKKLWLLILLVPALSILGFGQIERGGARKKIEVLEGSQSKTKINQIPLKSTCGDLSANAIEYQLVEKSSDRTGVIKVVGTVKNIAKFPFRVKEGKVKIKLVEVTKEKRKIVKGVKIKSLKEGNQISLEYKKRWYARSKSSKRPIYYILEIEYPRSKSFKLTHNDCRLSNNVGRRTTNEIDAFF